MQEHGINYEPDLVGLAFNDLQHLEAAEPGQRSWLRRSVLWIITGEVYPSSVILRQVYCTCKQAADDGCRNEAELE